MTISPSSTKAPPLERRTSALKGEIVEIWSQVQARVVQLAGGDSSKIQADLTIEGVLAVLDKAQDASAKKDSSIRDAFEKTLQFIDTVGGIVAGGAAEVRLFISCFCLCVFVDVLIGVGVWPVGAMLQRCEYGDPSMAGIPGCIRESGNAA